MLSFVAFLILDTVFYEELINLGLQKERNIDQIVSQLVEEARRSLYLEHFELIQVGPQLL